MRVGPDLAAALWWLYYDEGLTGLEVLAKLINSVIMGKNLDVVIVDILNSMSIFIEIKCICFFK